MLFVMPKLMSVLVAIIGSIVGDVDAVNTGTDFAGTLTMYLYNLLLKSNF